MVFLGIVITFTIIQILSVLSRLGHNSTLTTRRGNIHIALERECLVVFDLSNRLKSKHLSFDAFIFC